MLLVSVLASCSRLSAPDAHSGNGGDHLDGGASSVERAAYGLSSVVPDRDRALVTWRATPPTGAAPTVAVFTAEDPNAVYAAVPQVAAPGVRVLVVDGLDEDDDHWFGLGIDDGAGWRPVGPLLSVHTYAPIYVDPNAPAGGDGRSAASPLDDFGAAVFTAFADGGGNVWAHGGVFSDVALTLPPAVDVYGGFGPGFVLEARDTVLHATELRGRAGAPILALESSTDVVVLDGLRLRAGGGALDGVDVDRHPFELRGLDVRGCVRGLRLRNSLGLEAIPGLVVGSTFIGQSGPGISIGGALRLLVEASVCTSNGQEGLDADDLLAPDGVTVELVARDSVFSRNGAEGLDIDLAGPVGGGASGGRFLVEIDGCIADDNALDGFLIDLEHEALPEWSSEVVVRGTVARENALAGLHLDMDARGTAHVHRARFEGNAGHGLHVTSESAAGVVIASACAFTGNDEAGVRAELGNYAVLVSHSVLAGNRVAGLSSDGVRALATSSVAWVQGQPWPAAQSSLWLDPAATGTFLSAPGVYLRVVDASATTLGLEAAAAFAAGTPAEVAGDGVPRLATPTLATRVELAPFRAPRTPTTLALFSVGTTSVVEDWRPGAGSQLIGAGMASLGANVVDVGPFGAPGGGAPGDEGLDHRALFALRGTTPAFTTAIAANATVTLELSAAVDAASLPLGVAAESATGAPLAITPSAVGASIVVPAPAGGWPAGARLLVHTGLRASDGRANVAPVAIPVR